MELVETNAVALAVWGNFGPTVIRMIEAREPLHVSMRAGTVMSILGTATGRAFAAAMPADRIEDAMALPLGELYGAENVVERKPMMGGEDFSRYGMTDDKIPICLFWLGAQPLSVIEEAKKRGEPAPGLHSPFFYPDIEAALPIGVTAMSAAVLDAMRR